MKILIGAVVSLILGVILLALIIKRIMDKGREGFENRDN